MSEGDFTLDGVTWGDRGDLIVTSFDPSGFDFRGQSVDRPGGHGKLAGRDLLGGAVWTWEVTSNTPDGPTATAAHRALAAVWRGYLDDPDAVAELKLEAGGRFLSVYGRPGRYSPPPGSSVLVRQGAATAVLDFEVMEPAIYSQDRQQVQLGLVGPSGGGATWPVTWPLTWAAAAARAGIVRVDGDIPVPFQVYISGPVSGSASEFQIAGPGWNIDVDVPLTSQEQLVIDTRTMTARRNGELVRGFSRRTRLDARLRVGDSEVTFAAADDTQTVQATVSWQPGWASF